MSTLLKLFYRCYINYRIFIYMKDPAVVLCPHSSSIVFGAFSSLRNKWRIWYPLRNLAEVWRAYDGKFAALHHHLADVQRRGTEVRRKWCRRGADVTAWMSRNHAIRNNKWSCRTADKTLDFDAWWDRNRCHYSLLEGCLSLRRGFSDRVLFSELLYCLVFARKTAMKTGTSRSFGFIEDKEE